MWAAKRLAYHSGVLALARRARRRDRAVVLRYHAVTSGEDVEYAAPEICMPLAAFRLQMAFVRRAYHVVPLDALVDALHRGSSLPAGALAITFDDGYADNYRLAAPVLRACGLPATVYVATGSVGGTTPFWVAAVRVLARRGPTPIRVPGLEPIDVSDDAAREQAARVITGALVTMEADARMERIAEAAATAGVDVAGALAGTMLSADEIVALHREGWTIGAHTVTHSNMAYVPPETAAREIAESRDAVADIIGAPVTHFCYPNTGGRHRYFGPEIVSILKREGFRSATTSRPGAVRPGADPYVLPRLGVSPRLADVVDLATAVERQRLVA